MEKYIVYESYAFGKNYYDKSGKVYPDYTLKENNLDIPVMDKKQAENLAERFRAAIIKKA